MPTTPHPRITAYIESAAPFARPILKHVRQLVHRGCPDAVETIKWSMPHFLHGGAILCSMSAFKAHCAFGFWHEGMEKILGPYAAKSDTAMGSFGRITSLSDLPDDATMIRFIREAARLIDSGAPGRARTAAIPRTETPIPEDLATALQRNKAAARAFASFSPSHRREYTEWITEAKRPATREKRLATTLSWLSEGKPRNWKYQNC